MASNQLFRVLPKSSSSFERQKTMKRQKWNECLWKKIDNSSNLKGDQKVWELQIIVSHFKAAIVSEAGVLDSSLKLAYLWTFLRALEWVWVWGEGVDGENAREKQSRHHLPPRRETFFLSFSLTLSLSHLPIVWHTYYGMMKHKAGLFGITISVIVLHISFSLAFLTLADNGALLT